MNTTTKAPPTMFDADQPQPTKPIRFTVKSEQTEIMIMDGRDRVAIVKSSKLAETFTAAANACDGMADPGAEVLRLKHTHDLSAFILEGARMDREELKQLRSAMEYRLASEQTESDCHIATNEHLKTLLRKALQFCRQDPAATSLRAEVEKALQ